MTLKEFYSITGGDYRNVIDRLDSERIVIKFLRRFSGDVLFEQLEQEIVAGNQKEAFQLAHTFKGACVNMGLGSLEESTKQLTEALRENLLSQVPSLFEKVKEDYMVVVKAIESLDGI